MFPFACGRGCFKHRNTHDTGKVETFTMFLCRRDSQLKFQNGCTMFCSSSNRHAFHEWSAGIDWSQLLKAPILIEETRQDSSIFTLGLKKSIQAVIYFLILVFFKVFCFIFCLFRGVCEVPDRVPRTL